MRSILWVDVETTGSDPYEDDLLEIATMITDMSGEPISELKECLLKPPNLSRSQEIASDKVFKMHEKSGLWKDLWNADSVTIGETDEELYNWLSSFELEKSNTYLGGNSITLDREFMEYNLPAFYSLFSHRSIDVTSIALMLQGNFNLNIFRKNSLHRAGGDVLDSIREYKSYLNFFDREMRDYDFSDSSF